MLPILPKKKHLAWGIFTDGGFKRVACGMVLMMVFATTALIPQQKIDMANWRELPFITKTLWALVLLGFFGGLESLLLQMFWFERKRSPV
ncbi:MAG: hypothetical protein COT91_05520 [Candidatus Doudnabacteria bacterium CG10_big_fil_rev_8_21_14_0_10_41_10]|uniref:Uncharacterized protein n=1 Tax=Candidatus Doudnabacteria bacterium CG10_big_fil_rev_8_21_14_0_10_41_10 TaxID=1974551 RepID=A0A2H0VEC3_9BACT|nr:MAG: hypothetical protein COT91_05520 [Candidatus Doudnabacteria bacterium CG10_big_fil_rev_8_21_14_0_10_41_10]